MRYKQPTLMPDLQRCGSSASYCWICCLSSVLSRAAGYHRSVCMVCV